MAYVLYILLIFICISAQGLRCRMEQDTRTQEEFEDIVHNCLRHETEDGQKGKNNDENKGYNRNDQKGKINPSIGKHGEGDKYNNQDEEEYGYNEYDTDNSNNRDKSIQRKSFSQSNQKSQPYQYQGTKSSGNKRNQGPRNYSRNIGSPLESIEPCIIHCIFRQKKMLNQDNYIDKTNVMHVLTQKIHDAELREFVEDSVNECFDIINNAYPCPLSVPENSEGKCEDSKNFALCLEERGKNNCEDWDTSSHARGKGNTFSNINRNIREGSPLNREDNRRERQSFNTNNDDDKNDDYHPKEGTERSKTKHETSNEKTSNNHRLDNNEPKIKLSDYFNTRG